MCDFTSQWLKRQTCRSPIITSTWTHGLLHRILCSLSIYFPFFCKLDYRTSWHYSPRHCTCEALSGEHSPRCIVIRRAAFIMHLPSPKCPWLQTPYFRGSSSSTVTRGLEEVCVRYYHLALWYLYMGEFTTQTRYRIAFSFLGWRARPLDWEASNPLVSETKIYASSHVESCGSWLLVPVETSCNFSRGWENSSAYQWKWSDTSCNQYAWNRIPKISFYLLHSCI